MDGPDPGVNDLEEEIGWNKHKKSLNQIDNQQYTNSNRDKISCDSLQMDRK